MRPWQVIFRKEFLEVFRDGRTRFNVILSPLLLVPLILGVVMNMGVKQAEQTRSEAIPVAIVGLDKSPTLRTLLDDAENEKAARTRLMPMSHEEAERAIRDRKVRAAGIVPDDAESLMTEARPVPISILLDEGSQSSQEGAERLKKLLEVRGKRIVAERLSENGLSLTLVNPFSTNEESIKGGKSRGTVLLALFMPYMLSLWAITGGIYLANDTVAGEKERGTLETLLVSPVSRKDLVLGKFLAVAAVALTSSILSIIGFLWPFYVKLPIFSVMSKAGLSLGPTAILAMLLVQIPLAVLGAGVLLSISTFARNQKEAQTYLAPVLLAVTVAAMLSMMLKAEAPLYWAAVPITNAALVLKQALEGVTNLPFVAAACVASLAYAALAVLFATRCFQKESILLKA